MGFFFRLSSLVMEVELGVLIGVCVLVFLFVYFLFVFVVRLFRDGGEIFFREGVECRSCSGG